jgi:signal peptidase II
VDGKRSLSEQRVVGLCFFLIVVFFDHVSKFVVCRFLEPGNFVSVFSHLGIVHVRNRGIGFGLLSDGAGWQVFLVYFCIVTICTWLFVKYWLSDKAISSIAYALILGGAAGNLLDRLFRGSVVDFIDFYIEKISVKWLYINITNWHWPAFNLADSAIVLGIFLLCFCTNKPLRKRKR